MYNILDINEVDENYYGMFKNDITDKYTMIKCPKDGEVIQTLPWNIVMPNMFRTLDSLYSLYVVVKNKDDRLVLREISVPDSEEYMEREIDIQSLYESEQEKLETIHDVLMNQFITEHAKSSFFVLSNLGMHRIWYKDAYSQLSIPSTTDLKQRLQKTLIDVVVQKHLG